jgi:hypothetical protein
MGKVNWLEARLIYCADERASYDDVARKYKVAKSTITRRAVRERWPQLREEYQNEKFKKLLEKNADSQSEVEARHLKTIRISIKAAHNTIVGVAEKVALGTQTPKDIRELNAATTVLYRCIMMERTILRLPTKAPRFDNPDDLEQYQITMGFKDPPADHAYKEAKQALESLDRMIERRKMIQAMIDDVDRRGVY